MSWSPLTITHPTSNSAALGAGLTLLSVDPWTHGVSNGDGSNTNLSFPNAVNALVDQLTGISGAGLAIAVAAGNHNDLASQLNTLSAAFPLHNMARLARRAGKMADLHLSKFNLVPSVRDSASVAVNALPRIRALQRAELIKNAFDNAQTFKSSNPLSNLNSFETQRTAHETALATIQADAATGLTGGTGWRFYAANNIASSIVLGHPGHEYPLTAIMLFIGTPTDLAILTEIFPA